MKKEYVERLEKMANILERDFNIEQISNELDKYMKGHNYKKTSYKSL